MVSIPPPPGCAACLRHMPGMPGAPRALLLQAAWPSGGPTTCGYVGACGSAQAWHRRGCRYCTWVPAAPTPANTCRRRRRRAARLPAQLPHGAGAQRERARAHLCSGSGGRRAGSGPPRGPAAHHSLRPAAALLPRGATQRLGRRRLGSPRHARELRRPHACAGGWTGLVRWCAAAAAAAARIRRRGDGHDHAAGGGAVRSPDASAEPRRQRPRRVCWGRGWGWGPAEHWRRQADLGSASASAAGPAAPGVIERRGSHRWCRARPLGRRRACPGGDAGSGRRVRAQGGICWRRRHAAPDGIQPRSGA